MDSRTEGRLKERFSQEDFDQIDAFLERGFSLNGEIVIASIFMFGQENNKSVEEILEECESEWERNWQYQHPDLRGNPDAPGGAGQQNRRSLNNIYAALEIPNPMEV